MLRFLVRSRVLDLVLAVIGIVRAVRYVEHGQSLAAQPYADGLEGIGVVLGTAYLAFLVPALLWALDGLLNGCRPASIAARSSMLAVAAGVPIGLTFLVLVLL